MDLIRASLTVPTQTHMTKTFINPSYIDALRGRPTERIPVWLMRQAGRYLPEYRKLRNKAGNFMAMCQNPALACEVALQPLARFDLDAAIVFSDILTIPDAMGLGLTFVAGEGPRFAKSIRTEADIEQLPKVNIATDLRYVTDAVAATKSALSNTVPLIGFAGSPWTLACYMIEGKAGNFDHAKHMAYSAPELLSALIEKNTAAVIDYLRAKIQAGCDAVQIFDTWGGILSFEAYLQFSLQPMQQIVVALKASHPDTPVVVFTKNAGSWLSHIAAIQPAGIGLDWTVDPQVAREATQHTITLQGNLDPAALRCQPDVIIQMVAKMIAHFGHTRYIANLGHGVTPDINPEHVRTFVDAVHQLSTH